jgi:hypothetical protein
MFLCKNNYGFIFNTLGDTKTEKSQMLCKNLIFPKYCITDEIFIFLAIDR